nr:formin-like protein 3 [Aegilops tauschii subsp. strangulata]
MVVPDVVWQRAPEAVAPDLVRRPPELQSTGLCTASSPPLQSPPSSTETTLDLATLRRISPTSPPPPRTTGAAAPSTPEPPLSVAVVATLAPEAVAPDLVRRPPELQSTGLCTASSPPLQSPPSSTETTLDLATLRRISPTSPPPPRTTGAAAPSTPEPPLSVAVVATL